MRLIKAAPECQQQQQKRFALSGWQKKSIFSLQTGVYIQAKGRFGLPENKA